MTSNPLAAPLKALQFVVAFAQMNYAEATDHAIRSDASTTKILCAFISREDNRAAPRTTHIRITADAIRSMHKEAWRIVRAIAEQRPGEPITALKVTMDFEIWRPRDVDEDNPPPARLVVAASGQAIETFKYQLIRLLESVGVEKIRKCAAPDCDRIFVQVTRKEFCSTRCQSRIYMRSYKPPARLKAKRNRKHK